MPSPQPIEEVGMTTLDFDPKLPSRGRDLTEFRLILALSYPFFLIGVVAKRVTALVTTGQPPAGTQGSVFREAYLASSDAISFAFNA
jgi:hypothetical protein